MAIYKNKASQKVAVYATGADGLPKTGDAANISAGISKDGGANAATNDLAPTELDATNHKGIYIFDLLQAETNADLIVITPVSSTAGVTLLPLIIYTEPEIRSAALDQAIAELTGDPGATPTGNNALMLLYMALRNASTATASARTVENNAGTAILTATMSDNGTTFDQGKLAP